MEKHGDRAASELLKAYRAIVRGAVARFSGAEIRTEGDGFYVVFPSPSSAIRCSIAVLEEASQSTAAGGQATRWQVRDLWDSTNIVLAAVLFGINSNCAGVA